MINALPQLFGKNFLIGYVLPAALIIAAFMGIADLNFGTTFYPSFIAFIRSGSEKLPLGQFGALALAVWGLAVFLLGINYQLTRMLEGYGTLNPARLLAWYSKMIFRRRAKAMSDNDDARNTDYSEAAIDFAAKFPESEDLLLPTRVGNILRAAERYPQIIYNMEPMQIWMRLQSVAPATHLAMVDDAKAALDFWINLWFGALVIAAADVVIRWWNGHLIWSWSLPVAILAAIAIAKASQASALQLGALIKATFDLYRGDLANQLGIEIPVPLREERDLWQSVSQTMLFRDLDAADGMTPFRRKSSQKKSAGS